MNTFAATFGQRIHEFWNTGSDEQKKALLDEILAYANADRERFYSEVAEIRFDKYIDPLPVVLEALSKDAGNWGPFYVAQLDAILEAAYRLNDPEDVLSYLMEFSYIEKVPEPFTQEIVDRLHRELDSPHLSIRLAAICTLPGFMSNDAIWNREIVIDALQEQLNDKSWKIRCAAYTSLQFEKLLPEGYTRPGWEKFLPLVFGKGLKEA